jgi:fucose permease
VGAPMTATSLFVGQNFALRRASTLTLLNLTWSVGAMLAPLLASRLLAVSSWRAVYFTLAGAALLASGVVFFTIRDSAESALVSEETTGLKNVRRIAVFAVFFFLEVGMESMFGAWISTFVLRSTLTSVTLAAAATAVYWGGFLVSRGLAPILLLRVRPGRLLQFALPLAFGAASLLALSRSPGLLVMAILLLGAALAPIFPVALAAFFDRARHSSDTRFVLALSGFGGSVLPWLAGWISGHAGSLRAGLLAGPAVLLAMTAMLPLLGVEEPVRAE